MMVAALGLQPSALSFESLVIEQQCTLSPSRDAVIPSKGGSVGGARDMSRYE